MRWAAMLVAIVAVGCGPACGGVVPAPQPAPVPDDPGPGDRPSRGTCAEACEYSRWLHALTGSGCAWIAGSLGPDREPGTGDESTCEQVCVDQWEAIGYFPTGCILSAQSCAEVKACFQ